ncbi:hypothetical protein W02_27540 [Nitrospira sp. KM1]|nr:hypothetical protein W02_27540 [Nitrospira sp. KM1]
MGIPFSQYLTSIRITKAKLLLTGEGLSVTDVATMLGFSDSFAFSHFFKRIEGCSPSAFKRRQTSRYDLNYKMMAL